MSGRGDILDRMEEQEERKRLERINSSLRRGDKVSVDDLRLLLMDALKRVRVGAVYQHVKTSTLYKPTGVALQEKDLSVVVLYTPYDGGGAGELCFSRPIDEFLDRFQRVKQQTVWVPA